MAGWWPTALERRIAVRYLRGQGGTRSASLKAAGPRTARAAQNRHQNSDSSQNDGVDSQLPATSAASSIHKLKS